MLMWERMKELAREVMRTGRRRGGIKLGGKVGREKSNKDRKEETKS